MATLTEGLKIDAQGNVVSAPPIDTALKPGQFNDAPPVKPATATPVPTPAPAPLLASSTQSRQQFGTDQETLSKFATELEVARQTGLKIQEGVNALAAKEGQQGMGSTTTQAKPAAKDSTTQIAEFNKSIGRAANDSTGIGIREDGSIDVSGVPDSMKSAEQVNSEVDRDTDDAIAQLDAFAARFDATHQALVEGIKQKYEMRRAQTKDTNMRYLRGLTTMGYRSGRARYAPEIQSGILAAEERAGLARLSELDSEELSLIAQAQAAQDEKDFKLFHERTELLAQKRKEKNDEAQRLFQNSVALEQLAMQRAEEAREVERFSMDEEQYNLDRADQIATSIASSILPQLAGLEDTDRDLLIDHYAEKYDIDPEILAGSLQRAERALRLEELGMLKAEKDLTELDTQIIEADGRRQLIDTQTGEVIRDLGLADLPASTGGGGIGGGPGGLSAVAQAVIDDPALLSNFTPTERGKIITELANAGVDTDAITTEKLGAAQREHIDGFDTLLREAKASNLLLDDGLNTGPVASRVKIAGAALGGEKDFTTYRSSLDNMGSLLLLLRSGAAVTPQEFQRISGFIPQVTDDDKTAKTKIARFVEETTTAQQNYVKRATQTSQEIQQELANPTKKGESNDPLGIR